MSGLKTRTFEAVAALGDVYKSILTSSSKDLVMLLLSKPQASHEGYPHRHGDQDDKRRPFLGAVGGAQGVDSSALRGR